MSEPPASTGAIPTEPAPRCPVCSESGHVCHEVLVDVLFGAPGEWTMRACDDDGCGALWLDPVPTPEGVARAYADYHTHGHSSGRLEAVALRARRAVLEGFVGRLLGVAAERQALDLMYLGSTRPGRLLDVGSGDGARLERFAALGWQVAGVETDRRAAAVRPHLDVHVGTLDTAPFEPASFDAVIANQVIEHVHDPRGFLATVRALLVPGGTAVVVTPNAGSACRQHFGRHWRGLEPPRHLQVVTPSSLEVLGRQAGFTAVDVGTTPVNAQYMHLMSNRVRRRATGARESATTRLSDELASLRFQRQALRRHAADATSGEDCVLRATR